MKFPGMPQTNEEYLKYRPLIAAEARRCNILSNISQGIESMEDLIQEGYLVLEKAKSKYVSSKGSFLTLFKKMLIWHYRNMLTTQVPRRATQRSKPPEYFEQVRKLREIVTPQDIIILTESVLTANKKTQDALWSIWNGKKVRRSVFRKLVLELIL